MTKHDEKTAPIRFELSEEELKTIQGGTEVRALTMKAMGGFAIRNHALNLDGGFAIRNHALKLK
jgi:bacteriocin-like protein